MCHASSARPSARDTRLVYMGDCPRSIQMADPPRPQPARAGRGSRWIRLTSCPNGMRRLTLALLVLFGFGGDAWAWGDTGHTVVCEIAFRLALPDTRATIRKMIQDDPQFDTFSESCTFPDHPRKRADEHFINLPRDSKRLTSDQCPQADKCVLTAIINDTKILSSKASRREDKLIALKFLGHWVGDIHQPLHVSFKDDRGGNNITVSGQCSEKKTPFSLGQLSRPSSDWS
jgi:hypothetical protein